MNCFKSIPNALLMVIFPMALFACGQPDELTKDSNNEQQSERRDPAKVWPKLSIDVKKDPVVEEKITQLLAKMTLAQKVAQMIQPEIRDITPEDMRQYGFGSYLNGGGAFPNNDKHATPQDWINLAEQMYQASIDDSLDGSRIPTMWGTDAVHGHNNVIGATLFPHNIGLGAANNPALIEEIAKATAAEVMATGIDWVFAPTVATVRDDRWGRTYEGYSEDPDIVKAYARAVVHGLQGHAEDNFLGDDRVISTVKHFIGDGGTVGGDDQGDNIETEQALFTIHAQGYVGGLSAGAQSVMASFNSWHGEKVHGNQYLLTQVLKEQMGFDGFVVGDWNGHGQIPGCSNENCPQAVNAGLDIYMVPTEAWKPLYENLIAQVEQGIIPQSRIDDAVSRILRVKLRAGLFDKPSPANRLFSGKTDLIGSQAHRAIAKQAVRESLVLLKNKGQILPLSPTMNILVAGDGADNIGKQSGGWSITWQGTNNKNSDFPGGTSIYDGLAKQVRAAGGKITLSEQGQFSTKPDVAIVVFGEEPYAEGQGDKDNLAYQSSHKSDLALLKHFKEQAIPVVAVFISGRPLWMNAELNASDAFVAAWLLGSEGEAVADVLLADMNQQIQYDFKGKLSFSWPNSPLQTVNRFDRDYQPLFEYGYGLQYGEVSKVPDTLATDFVFAKENKNTAKVFSGIVMKPWQMLLTSGEQSHFVDSNSMHLPGIAYRTVDKEVQEDSFRIMLSGAERAGLKFTTMERMTGDLSLINTEQSVLVVNVQRESELTGELQLSMTSVDAVNNQQNRQVSVNITEQFAQLPLNEWVDLSIDLGCFVDQGIQLDQLSTAFELSASGKLTLSFSDIRFVTQGANSAIKQCP